MNQSANRAFHHFAGNRSLQATPVEKLRTLATGYPFFPVAQFFLAKKLKEEYDDNFVSQSHKAVLYFHNPLLFDLLLNTEWPAENASPQKEKTGLPAKEEFTTSATSFTQGKTIQEPIVQTFAEGENKNFVDFENSAPENSKDSEDPLTSLGKSFLKTFPENNEATVTENDANNTELKEGTFAEPDDLYDAGKLIKSTENLSPAEEPDEHERMFRSIKAMLDSTAEDAEVSSENTEIPLDPYYTIDYFASQGIKLDLEVNPQDKLGQNLKKFTQWLRHMKKLGPEDAKVEIENSEAEADVQKMADSSNSVREVVTEAMAAVLEKQGKKSKAIELYNKLSFLNPDKSTYFAAQIEKLKGF